MVRTKRQIQHGLYNKGIELTDDQINVMLEGEIEDFNIMKESLRQRLTSWQLDQMTITRRRWKNKLAQRAKRDRDEEVIRQLEARIDFLRRKAIWLSFKEANLECKWKEERKAIQSTMREKKLDEKYVPVWMNGYPALMPKAALNQGGGPNGQGSSGSTN